MKLHETVVEKLSKLYETFGGHRSEARLKDAIRNVNFSVYRRQNGEEILVLTEDLEKLKQG